MGSPYQLLFSRAFDDDLDGISAYDAVIVRAHVAVLADQAEVETRNRKRLLQPVTWCPEATWRLRIRSCRVLYRVDESLVRAFG